ncbi:MAG TPA: hypothetical protein VIZ18_11075 [Ktedonobacteraceae bacterium]
MKAATDVSKLLLEIVELQRQKIAAAQRLGWVSQEFSRQAIASLDRRVTRLSQHERVR